MEAIKVPSAGEPEWQGEITDAQLDEVLGGLLIPNQAFAKALAREVKQARAALKDKDDRIAELNECVLAHSFPERFACWKALGFPEGHNGNLVEAIAALLASHDGLVKALEDLPQRYAEPIRLSLREWVNSVLSVEERKAP